MIDDSAASNASQPSTSLARSTIIVMGGLSTSIVFGFLRQRVIAVRFGTGAELDAFTAANGIPELLFTMLAGGALAFAFIPIYTQILATQDQEVSNLLVSRVINTILLLIGTIGALLAVFAPTLVRASWGVGPNFPPEVQALAAELMRVLFISTVIFAASSILTGALHAHQHFLLPALAPSMYSLGMMLGAIVLGPRIGIHGLAWGAVLGAGMHLLIQLPGAWHFRIRWRFSLGWGDPLMRSVAVLMAPRVLDLLMARASIDWINANIGSGLGVGRVSALRYAFQLMNTPWTLIGTAIGIAIFPTMSAFAAKQDVSAQRRAFSGALRAILLLALPAAVALIVLGKPVIGLLFEGGEFTPESTELVFFALQFYVVALLSQSVLEVVVRAFAAQKDTLTPLVVSFFTTALNVFLAITLARPFQQGGLEHGGLALANGVAVGVEALIGLTILHFRWGGVDAMRILTDALKAALAAAVMGVTVYLFVGILQPGRLVTVLAGGAIGGGVYLLIALLLGLEEVRTLPVSIVRGLLRRGSAGE